LEKKVQQQQVQQQNQQQNQQQKVQLKQTPAAQRLRQHFVTLKSMSVHASIQTMNHKMVPKSRACRILQRLVHPPVPQSARCHSSPWLESVVLEDVFEVAGISAVFA